MPSCVTRREAFRWVARLQRAHPGDERSVAYQSSLAVLVDAAAVSPEAADAAYFTLEAMRNAVTPRRPPPQDRACQGLWTRGVVRSPYVVDTWAANPRSDLGQT